MAKSASVDGIDSQETVLVAARNTTADLIYHLPDPEDPTQPRCHIVRLVDRPWRSRDAETIVHRRCCKSCEAAAEKT